MAQLIKSINGLPIASVKTRNGRAIASAKTINGLDNTASGGTPTLLYSTMGANNAWDPITQAAYNFYTGQFGFSDAVAHTITKIVVKLGKGGGSITGRTYNVRFWTDASNDLGSNVGTSDNVTGSDSWSATAVDFNFSSPFAQASSTLYHITVDAGTVDASNYANGYYIGSNGTPGELANWNNSKSNLLHYSGFEFQLEIWGY